ncbi:uncharacterized protein UTRI_03683_B [Ustilago trichophora]|uniref:Uncharacterized protein n=1 Tax=Ustilago trichophora TaxID=86804 RepID=A0A5C3E304_9BASI|nr:uncharacterized protein UTRI_03683_B [Ustilago trichophora]
MSSPTNIGNRHRRPTATFFAEAYLCNRVQCLFVHLRTPQVLDIEPHEREKAIVGTESTTAGNGIHTTAILCTRVSQWRGSSPHGFLHQLIGWTLDEGGDEDIQQQVVDSSPSALLPTQAEVAVDSVAKQNGVRPIDRLCWTLS